MAEEKRKFRQIGGDYGNPLEYGGVFVAEDNGDVLAFEEPDDCEGREDTIPVFRVSRPADLSHANWIDWPGLLRTMGLKEIPEDPYDQLLLVAAYWGWAEFNPYPESFSTTELASVLDL